MKVLVVNCGSSSVKYQFINMDNQEVIAKGVAEKIGETLSLFSYKTATTKRDKISMKLADHKEAMHEIIAHLMHKEYGVVAEASEIDAVGHRLVHGGDAFADTVKIDAEVLAKMEECIELAPLHNPANILGVQACQTILGDTPQVGVFDTAFHQTMEPKAYLYPIPLKFYKEYRIRRYGFHGTSHKFVAMQAAEFMKKPLEELKIVTLHLGNGASVAAVKNGQSIDTSMGMTPLEGLMMGTRSGDIDPAIIEFLIKNKGYSLDEVMRILNKESGLLGISEHSNDMREITEAVAQNDERSTLALDVFSYRVKKYVGAYAAAMGGIDVLVFTGGIGEHTPEMRELVCADMEFLGIHFDNDKNYNNERGSFCDMSQPESQVKILRIPTDEELMIALETKRILGK